MITLTGFAPAFGALSASSFCVKAQYLLNLSGLEWQRKDVDDPRSYPKGKLPALETDAGIIGDSEAIRAWIEAQGIDLDAGLSKAQRAVSRAFIRMADEHMYFHMLLDRWNHPDAWPEVKRAYFSGFPPILRSVVPALLRRTQLKGMRAQGLGRLSIEERLAKIEPDLQAIRDQLAGNDFLFGDAPTAADASVVAVLDGMARTPGKTPLARRVTGDDVLSAYIARGAATMG